MGAFLPEISLRDRNTRLFLGATALAALVIGAIIAQWPWTGMLAVGLFLVLTLLYVRAEFAVYLFLLSSIFFKYRLDLGFATLSPSRAMFIVAIMALPIIFVRRGPAFNRGLARTGLIVGLLSFLFLSGWARSPASFRPTANVTISLLILWLAYLLYLTYFVDGRARFHSLIKVYIATSTALALYGLYEVAVWLRTGTLPELPFAEFTVESVAPSVRLGGLAIPRIESLFHDANLLAVYLLVAVLILFTFLLRGRTSGPYKLFVGILLLLHVAAIVLTISRSGIVLLAFSFLLLVPRTLGNSVARALVVILLFALAVIALLVLSFPASLDIAGNYFEAYTSRFSFEDEVRRVQYAEAALGLFAESPFAGVGMGHPALRGVSRTGLADTAHSFYLTILSHYGLIGLALVLFLLWPLLRETIKISLQGRASYLDLSLAIAVWAVLFFQIVYDNLFGELMLFPFALLYIWALNRERFQEQVPDSVANAVKPRPPGDALPVQESRASVRNRSAGRM
jgi:O-antigen ligase